MNLKMELRQQQKLSPQMIQTMKIIQMSSLELRDYLANVAMDNPMLEMDVPSTRVESIGQKREESGFADQDRQNLWYDRDDRTARNDFAVPEQPESLYEYLHAQLSMDSFDENLQEAIECILSGLDDDGYLRESAEELAKRCSQDINTIQKAEHLIKQLDPPGVGTRSLSECLLLQLDRNEENRLARAIVQDYLGDVAKQHFHHIAVQTGSSQKEVRQACELIRSLDPKPGARFAQTSAMGYELPDLLVENTSGRYTAQWCEDNDPKIIISPVYQQMLKEQQAEDVQKYLREKMQQIT